MSPDDQSTTGPATAPDTKLDESGLMAPSAVRADRTAIRPRAQHPLRREITPQRWHLLVDIFMLGAAVGAVVLTAPGADDPVENPVWLVTLPLGVLTLLMLRGMYAPRIGPRFLDDAAYIAAATAFTVMAITFTRVLFTGEEVPGSQGLREWFFAAAFLTVGHAAVTLAETTSRRKRGGGRPTLIIGAGRVGHLLAKRLLASPEIGLHPVGFLDPAVRATSEHWEVPILGDLSTIEQAVLEHQVEHAIIGFSRSPPEVEPESLQRLQELGVSVSIVPRLFEVLPDRITVERVGALPLISISPRVSRSWQVAAKYVFDRAIAAVAILVLSPLLILAAVGVLVSVGRPLLFRQRRVGLDRREFDMLKFRTMRGQPDHARSFEAGWEAFAHGLAPGGVEGADRRTRFGTLLRRASLDELPQLFNVLRGEMSIVGPRPERPEYVRAFEERVRRYDLRHRVKAGITGWAQVHGLRGRTPLAERVEYDNYYIENWSLWLDVKIILLTVLAVLRGRHE